MTVAYTLHSLQGPFVGFHDQIFFLNSNKLVNSLKSLGKIDQIFGPRTDIISSP